MDLIGASELLISWPSTRTSPLPRRALLGPEHAAQVGQHQQPVRAAVLPKSSAAHLPAPGAPGKRGLERARRLALEARRPGRARSASDAEQALDRLAQQPLAAAVDQPEPLRPPSNANTATSISSMTRRSSAVASSAWSRCERSVSLSVFTSSSASPSPSSVLAPRARIE